ncbi:MAG: helix-turn-helix transcriptional regulator [Bacteroidales bacterium]|nr:helix-turn-helix transcriptional regulator [Bacteroidales bacterium]MDD4711805.1 helix-turn-helix transcriptional regulator [Bacteroidales bacterium]
MRKPDFGTKLVEVRRAKGLTQEEVAERCKITVRTIQRIESGVVQPRAFTIKIISDVLGIDFFEASNTGYDANRESLSSNLKKPSFQWYLKELFNLKTKTMKKISILTTSFLMMGLAMFVFISKIQAQSDNKNVFKSIVVQYNDDKTIRRIDVRFSNHLTFDSLIFIKNDLKAKGITINYKTIGFDEKGYLLEISCYVKSNRSSESGSFGMGLLNTTNKDKKIGFFYDFSKNAKPSFCAGACDL